MLPKIFLVGNLSLDPQPGVTNNGTIYSRFTIACSFYNSKTKQYVSNFFRCVAWNQNANFINQNVKKGFGVFVEAHLNNNSYTNSDGKIIYSNDIIVERIEITNNRNFSSRTTNNFNAIKDSNNFQVDLDFDNSVPIASDAILVNTKISNNDFNQEIPSISDDDDDGVDLDMVEIENLYKK